MTILEQYDRQIPEYYNTMYLDGYTPAQILRAAKRGLYQQHMERNTIEKDVRSAVTAALQDIF